MEPQKKLNQGHLNQKATLIRPFQMYIIIVFCRVAGIKQKKTEPYCAPSVAELTNQSYNIGGNLKYYPSILHEMVKACFICVAKDVRLFEIRSNMKQSRKWFEAF
jgi:hypothetical protein